MYDVRPNLIIGFHGCDEVVCNSLINNPDNIKISQQPFDWLGYGMYFWENNYERALSWALEKQRREKINKPAVIGAVISLGNCCDFLDSKNTRILEFNYSNCIKGFFLPRREVNYAKWYGEKFRATNTHSHTSVN